MEAQLHAAIEVLMSTTPTADSLEKATATIEGLAALPEFYTVISGILMNAGILPAMRHAAAVHMSRSIRKYWKQFPDEFKRSLIRGFPAILEGCPAETLGVLKPVSDLFCEVVFVFDADNSFAAEVQFIVETVMGLIRSGNWRVALIISGSVFKVLKNPQEGQMTAFHDQFSQTIMPGLAGAIGGFTEPGDFAYAFQCVARMLRNEKCAVFMTTGPVFIGGALKVLEMVVHEKSGQECCAQIMKLLARAVVALAGNMNGELLGSFMNAVHMCIARSLNEGTKSLAIKVLYVLVVKNNLTRDMMKGFINTNPAVIVGLLAPVFNPSEETIADFENDPNAFIAENHRVSHKWDDVKASASRFLARCAKETVLGKSVAEFSVGVIANFMASGGNPGDLFGACHLLSTVIRSVEGYQEIVARVLPLMRSDIGLVRAGVLLILRGLGDQLPFDQNVFKLCCDHLLHPSRVVVYYAALVFSTMLECEAEQDPNAQQVVRSVVGSNVEGLYTLFHNMSSEFHDDELAHAFCCFAKFFGSDIMPHIVDFFADVLNVLVQSAAESESASVIMTSKSLDVLVDVIGNHSHVASEVYALIFQMICRKVIEISGSPFQEQLLVIITCSHGRDVNLSSGACIATFRSLTLHCARSCYGQCYHRERRR